ncbi:MAG: YraN family protein [Atribacterota bacterium]
MHSRKELGNEGERITQRLVISRWKMKVLETNFRSRLGEIDLIARDGTDLVFMEVKTRMESEAGLPEDSITPTKQDRIQKTALFYLISHGLNPEETTFRFDVVSITFPLNDPYHPQIRYYKYAF